MTNPLTTVKKSMDEYLQPAKQWYRGLAQREQMAVSILGVVAVVFCLYWLLWSPLMTKRDDAKQRYVAQQQLLEWMQEHESLIRGAQRTTSGTTRIQPSDKDVLTLVNSSAASAGVVLRSFSPEGNNKLRLQLEQQEFIRVMQWLYELEQSYGIEVSNIDISAGNLPSTVNVRATLERDT